MDLPLLEKLAPHIKKIYFCIKSGFDKAVPIMRNASTVYSSSTRASIIRDHILAEVRNAFPPADILEKRDGLIVLKIEGALIKFKKLNKRFLAGNIPTKQATDYTAQLNLPGMSATLTHLHAGYVLDKSGFGLQSINLTQPETRLKNSWCLNIENFISNNLEVPLPQIVEAIGTLDVSPPKLSAKATAKKNTKKKVSNE